MFTLTGNLLDIFGEVTGIKNFRMKDLRSGCESEIQESKGHSNDPTFNCHSPAVARKYYDSLSGTRRSIFVNSLSKDHNNDDSDDDPDHELDEIGKDDHQTSRENAGKYIEELKRRKNIRQDWRPEIVTEEDISKIRAVFPYKEILSKSVCRVV